MLPLLNFGDNFLFTSIVVRGLTIYTNDLHTVCIQQLCSCLLPIGVLSVPSWSFAFRHIQDWLVVWLIGECSLSFVPLSFAITLEYRIMQLASPQGTSMSFRRGWNIYVILASGSDDQIHNFGVVLLRSYSSLRCLFSVGLPLIPMRPAPDRRGFVTSLMGDGRGSRPGFKCAYTLRWRSYT